MTKQLPETHTAMKLSRTLEKCGLSDMAAKAATGYYHDFLSEIDFPEMQLLNDLKAAAEAGNVSAPELIRRHINGEFDASFEECEEWAASPEGKEIIAAFSKDLTGKNQ